MKDKQREVLDIALDKLKKELEINFLSPDRVAVLTNTVAVLMNTSYLEEKVAALERQLAEQPDVIIKSDGGIALSDDILNEIERKLAERINLSVERKDCSAWRYCHS